MCHMYITSNSKNVLISKLAPIVVSYFVIKLFIIIPQCQKGYGLECFEDSNWFALCSVSFDKKD